MQEYSLTRKVLMEASGILFSSSYVDCHVRIKWKLYSCIFYFYWRVYCQSPYSFRREYMIVSFVHYEIHWQMFHTTASKFLIFFSCLLWCRSGANAKDVATYTTTPKIPINPASSILLKSVMVLFTVFYFFLLDLFFFFSRCDLISINL